MKFIIIRKNMMTRFNRKIINVDKVKDIPCDYYGIMGVPITFLDKWCPGQFELMGMLRPGLEDGRQLYRRLAIRRKMKEDQLFFCTLTAHLIEQGKIPEHFDRILYRLKGQYSEYVKVIGNV